MFSFYFRTQFAMAQMVLISTFPEKKCVAILKSPRKRQRATAAATRCRDNILRPKTPSRCQETGWLIYTTRTSLVVVPQNWRQVWHCVKY